MLEPVLRPLSSLDERTNDEPMSLPPPGMYRPIGDGLPRATFLQSTVLEWLLAKEGWPAPRFGQLVYERLMLAAVPGRAGLNWRSSPSKRPSTFSQEDALLKEAAHPMARVVCNRSVTELQMDENTGHTHPMTQRHQVTYRALRLRKLGGERSLTRTPA